MSKIYKFPHDADTEADNNYISNLLHEDMIAEANRIELYLNNTMSDIHLSEEESQNIYANIMREIMKLENSNKTSKK